MKQYQLSEFLALFLEHQKLQDFKLVLEPRYGHRNRHSKRGNTQILAKSPRRGRLKDTDTVQDLLEYLYSIAPDVGKWVASDEYKACLYTAGKKTPMGNKGLLGKLRGRSDRVLERAEKKSQSILQKAFGDCDGLLPLARVNEIARAILAKR